MGYETYGERVGRLNGMPVYKVSVSEWNLSDTQANECFYWVGELLFYHDVKVGTVEKGGCVDFDEDKFNNVRRAWEDNDPVHANLPIPVPTRVEEARPVEEEEHLDRNDMVDAVLRQGEWTVRDMLKGCCMAADEFLKTVKEA